MSIIIGKSRIKLDETESTNKFASYLLKTEIPDEGLVISASFQSKGKGQANNQWYSDYGKNLLFSVILFPYFLPPEKQFYLSKVISLGIKDFLMQYTKQVSIKWPNDIYVDDKKIAGILIENTIQGNSFAHSITGVGLNINQESFPDDIPNPVALCAVLDQQLSLDNLLNELLFHLNKRYIALKENNFPNLDMDYYDSLYLLNITHQFEAGNTFLEGKITGVNTTGRLIIESSGQKLDFGFKEIKF
jgi:BirA family biotin operon repressor/biotin-[acetyl-CoA-carboxylase] ligase